MTHVRQQLRDWLKQALKGSDLAGDRVYVRRMQPLKKALQPTLLVSIEGEQAVSADMEPVEQRTITVRVTACVKDDSEDGENALDALGVHVERVFANDPTLGGLAMDYQYQAAEFAFQADGEKTLGTAGFTFAVTVETARGNPETALSVS